jgi:hypothetical protein
MSFIPSVLGSVIGKIFPNRSYWAVKLSTGKWCCELDTRFDAGIARPFDWTLDLVDTGDVEKIKELWLFCPPSPGNPLGSTARLPIVEPGTAFQFKVASLHALGASERWVESQIIGRVEEKETQACTCFIWDAPLRLMSTPYTTTLQQFGSWREGIAPIGALSHTVLGLRL